MTTHAALRPGNVAVITGGADGIGLAAAKYYKSLGMNVCIADIDSEQLDKSAGELGDALTVVTDVTQLADVQALRDQALERFGRVDVLMNNAGVARHCASWSEIDAWRAVLETNLWGVINGIHSFLPSKIEQGRPGQWGT